MKPASRSLIRAFALALAGTLGLAEGIAVAADDPTVALTVEPVGYAVYPIPSRAAELSYYPVSDGAIALSYATGSLEQLLTKYQSELLLLRYRFSWGAFSRLSLGLGTRSIEYARTRTTAGVEYEVEIQSKSLVGEASFGNQLTFGPLAIGCDWIGVVVPLSELSSKEDFPDDVSEDDQESYKADAAKFGARPTLQFMRVFVGLVF